MKKQINRLMNAIQMGVLVWRKPENFNTDSLRMASDITTMIFDVGKDQKHRMTRLCLVHVHGTTHEVVSLWAGAGIGSSPTKRIEELLEENRLLKRELFLDSKKDNQ